MDLIIYSGVDVTNGYENWFEIGRALVKAMALAEESLAVMVLLAIVLSLIITQAGKVLVAGWRIAMVPLPIVRLPITSVSTVYGEGVACIVVTVLFRAVSSPATPTTAGPRDLLRVVVYPAVMAQSPTVLL